MDVHLRDLRYFVTVAEELHFTRAAQRLFVSQPALSRQIARLERDLRVTLLIRDRRHVRLTAAGTTLLDYARVTLADWDAAQRHVSDVAHTAATVLRIGMQTGIGRGIITEISTALRSRRPDWRLNLIQIDWHDPTSGLADHSTDFALVWLPIPTSQQFRWIVLATEPRHLAVAATHRLTGANNVEFARIADEIFVAMPEESAEQRDFWLATTNRDRPAIVGAVARNADEAFEAVAAGLGVVLVAHGNAVLYDRPDIVSIPVTDIPPAQLALAWRADDHRDVLRDVTELIGQHVNTHKTACQRAD